MIATGTVTELHRWPVKSMAGEPTTELLVDDRGAAGDRTYALFDRFKDAPRRLTARQVPRMLAWRAAYPGSIDAARSLGDPPLPALTAPDGRTFNWDDPALPEALAHDLGREVSLHRDPAGQQDLARSLLLTTETTLRALEAELSEPLDLRRFRTNIHVVLDGAAFAEEVWEGRRVRIGEVELEALHPCERCVIPTRHPDNQSRWPELLKWLNREHRCLFGINLRALSAGRIGVGDMVQVH